jgi:hypothetical protein
MQFLVLVVMEDDFSQFDPDRFAYRLLVHIDRLKHPPSIRQPAVAELLPVKTLLGFHGFHDFCLSGGPSLCLSLAYYENDASILRDPFDGRGRALPVRA